MKELIILCPRFILGNSLGITVIFKALSFFFLLCCKIPLTIPEACIMGDPIKELSSSVGGLALLCTSGLLEK